MTRTNTEADDSEITFDSSAEDDETRDVRVGDVYEQEKYGTTFTLEVGVRVDGSADLYHVEWEGNRDEMTAEDILEIVTTFDYELVEEGVEAPEPAEDGAAPIPVEDFEEGDEVVATHQMRKSGNPVSYTGTVTGVEQGDFDWAYLDVDVDGGHHLRFTNITRVVEVTKRGKTIATNAEIRHR